MCDLNVKDITSREPPHNHTHSQCHQLLVAHRLSPSDSRVNRQEFEKMPLPVTAQRQSTEEVNSSLFHNRFTHSKSIFGHREPLSDLESLCYS